MGTNCASLVAELFPFCYARDFMLSLSAKTQAIINCPYIVLFEDNYPTSFMCSEI